MPNLVLVRHGAFERVADAEGRREECLTAAGEREAWAVAARLAALERSLVIYASPQGRALATARILGDVTGHSVSVDAELAELRLRLAADEPEARSAELWARARSNVDTPPEPGAESMRGLQLRALATLRGALRVNPDATVVAVTHAGVLEALWSHLAGHPLARRGTAKPSIPYGAVFEWRVTLRGAEEEAQALAVNAVDHLALNLQ